MNSIRSTMFFGPLMNSFVSYLRRDELFLQSFVPEFEAFTLRLPVFLLHFQTFHFHFQPTGKEGTIIRKKLKFIFPGHHVFARPKFEALEKLRPWRPRFRTALFRGLREIGNTGTYLQIIDLFESFDFVIFPGDDGLVIGDQVVSICARLSLQILQIEEINLEIQPIQSNTRNIYVFRSSSVNSPDHFGGLISRGQRKFLQGKFTDKPKLHIR